MKTNEMIFYTDGACSPRAENKPGGWACVQLIPYQDKLGFKTDSFTGNKTNTTNNEMELIAAYMAILKAFKEGAKQVTLFTDSSYVANSISKNWLMNWYKNDWCTQEGTPVKNKEIWTKMYKLVYTKKLIVKIVLVKGHVGDPLNDLADALAVEAKESLEKELKQNK